MVPGANAGKLRTFIEIIQNNDFLNEPNSCNKPNGLDKVQSSCTIVHCAVCVIVFDELFHLKCACFH